MGPRCSKTGNSLVSKVRGGAILGGSSEGGKAQRLSGGPLGVMGCCFPTRVVVMWGLADIKIHQVHPQYLHFSAYKLYLGVLRRLVPWFPGDSTPPPTLMPAPT